MADKHETDAITGTATTGHVWDGIRELNTPLPRWWLWLFYATIIWSMGYWIVYPSWPLVSSYTTGMFNWSSREAVVSDLDALKAQRGPMVAKLAAASLQEIVADPQLLEFARAQGRPAFGENCAPCHGAGGGGSKGYPNLNDNDWIWGGKLDEIAETIRHGIRPVIPKRGWDRPCLISAVTADSSAPRSKPLPTTSDRPPVLRLIPRLTSPLARRSSCRAASPVTARTARAIARLVCRT
jgi:cbb3-type cytochrome c oxidase subunit III